MATRSWLDRRVRSIREWARSHEIPYSDPAVQSQIAAARAKAEADPRLLRQKQVGTKTGAPSTASPSVFKAGEKPSKEALRRRQTEGFTQAEAQRRGRVARQEFRPSARVEGSKYFLRGRAVTEQQYGRAPEIRERVAETREQLRRQRPTLSERQSIVLARLRGRIREEKAPLTMYPMDLTDAERRDFAPSYTMPESKAPRSELYRRYRTAFLVSPERVSKQADVLNATYRRVSAKGEQLSEEGAIPYFATSPEYVARVAQYNFQLDRLEPRRKELEARALYLQYQAPKVLQKEAKMRESFYTFTEGISPELAKRSKIEQEAGAKLLSTALTVPKAEGVGEKLRAGYRTVLAGVGLAKTITKTAGAEYQFYAAQPLSKRIDVGVSKLESPYLKYPATFVGGMAKQAIERPLLTVGTYAFSGVAGYGYGTLVKSASESVQLATKAGTAIATGIGIGTAGAKIALSDKKVETAGRLTTSVVAAGLGFRKGYAQTVPFEMKKGTYVVEGLKSRPTRIKTPKGVTKGRLVVEKGYYINPAGRKVRVTVRTTLPKTGIGKGKYQVYYREMGTGKIKTETENIRYRTHQSIRTYSRSGGKNTSKKDFASLIQARYRDAFR